MSTDTPRTDKEVHIAWECFAPTKYVPADFARQLERELAAAQTHLRRIVEARENLANGGGIAALLSAIQAAKEEISK